MSYAIEDYWKVFRENRFTKSQLWRAFGHRAFPGFPTKEWLEEMGIGRVVWLESAPGVRGGEGYRLTAEAVESMRKLDSKARARDARLQQLMASVRPRIGKLRCSEGKLRWECRRDSALPPSGLRYSYFALSWTEKTTSARVQRDLDVKAIEIAKLALKNIDIKRAEIARLNALIDQVNQRSAGSPADGAA